jgi:hypothetical protein
MASMIGCVERPIAASLRLIDESRRLFCRVDAQVKGKSGMLPW